MQHTQCRFLPDPTSVENLTFSSQLTITHTPSYVYNYNSDSDALEFEEEKGTEKTPDTTQAINVNRGGADSDGSSLESINLDRDSRTTIQDNLDEYTPVSNNLLLAARRLSILKLIRKAGMIKQVSDMDSICFILKK